jgi:hypothetical protein
MKMYVVGGYKDGKIRVGLLDKVWKSKAGTELVTLKILDHYKEHKTVYRTYHKKELDVMKVLDVDDESLTEKNN